MILRIDIIYPVLVHYIGGSAQDSGNSGALAVELWQSYAKPLVWR